MKLNTENTAREEEIKQNPQRLSLPKPINIDLGTGKKLWQIIYCYDLVYKVIIN